MKKYLKKNITGGESLIRSLYKEGVRVIFGLPGIQLYHALAPILKYPDLKFITTRHEQATTYMADGYARATGKIGVAIVTRSNSLSKLSSVRKDLKKLVKLKKLKELKI